MPSLYRDPNKRLALLSASLGAAVTGQFGSALSGFIGANVLAVGAVMTYGTGGTSANFILQTSFDGSNWADIASIAFATGTSARVVSLIASNLSSATTSGVLSANSVNNGLLADNYRVLWGNAGTYSATTVVITAIAKG